MDGPSASVRPYRPADGKSLRALAPRLTEGVAQWRDPAGVRAAVDSWVADAIANPGEDSTLLVAEIGRSLVGFISVRERNHWAGERDAYVGELVVDHAHEGRGIGRALVDAAVAWAGERGVTAVTLETRAANARARAFYARIGFLEEDVRLTLPLGKPHPPSDGST